MTPSLPVPPPGRLIGRPARGILGAGLVIAPDNSVTEQGSAVLPYPRRPSQHAPLALIT